MPVNFQCFGIAISQDTQISIFFEWPRKVDKIAVSSCNQRSIGQTRADRFGHVERGRALQDLFDSPIRKLDLNAVCHRLH